MKVKQLLIMVLVLFIGSAGMSYALKPAKVIDGEITSDQQQVEDGETELGLLLQISPDEPKTESCPLNGQLYTQTEKQAWSARRPLAVMIENSPDARPHSGLSSADLVFEAVAEGGVTRFMALYYCDAQRRDVTIAPVRSARSYFVDWASGFNRPLYAHVGGANLPGPADALGQISQYGWSLENDLNQFSIGYPTFVRNNNRLDRQVATEHTMESSSEKLWAVAEERGWTNMSPELKIGRLTIPAADWLEGFEPPTFADDPADSGTTTSISYDFWSGYDQFAVAWNYDAASRTYLRNTAGSAQIDLNNQEQVAAKTVVVLLTDEKGPIDELKHMLYRTTGTGEALIFSNGNFESVTWSKKTREDELRFIAKGGKEYAFARGPIWISVLDRTNKVTY
jgi:hypothetical protein